MSTNLSNNFTLEQLTASSVALRKGIDNTPNADQVANLTVLAQTLDRVEAILGHPIIIDSGFRCPKLNSAVGGAWNSAHLQGYAADFICPAFGDPLAICKALGDSGLIFDQLIQEGTWVHLSVDPQSRQDVLTATFVAGKATYSKGLA